MEDGVRRKAARHAKKGSTQTGGTGMKPYSLTAKSLAVLALGVAVGFGAARPAAAAAPESKDPIKIALMDWTSVNLNAHIYGDILKKLGYNVEYVTADYLSSLTTGLTNGDVDIGLEYWDTTAGDAMKASEPPARRSASASSGRRRRKSGGIPSI
jgi:ABC-type proline/glycine betaine transport systems, periplasmic components